MCDSQRFLRCVGLAVAHIMTRQTCPVTEDVHEIRMVLHDWVLKGPERFWEDIFDFCIPIYRNTVVGGEQTYTKSGEQL